MRRNNSSLSTLSSGGGSSNNKKLLAKDWSLSTLGADGEIVPPKKRNPTAHKEELFRALSQYTGKKRSAAVANALSRAVDLQDMRDANGFSVLSKALLLAVEEDVLEMLVSFGAAVDTLEPGGLTPLHTLVKHQRPRELAVLLTAGPLPSSKRGPRWVLRTPTTPGARKPWRDSGAQSTMVCHQPAAVN